MEEVGIRIRDIRKRLGISMKELADKVGVSYLSIYRIEKGKVSPSTLLLSKIADALSYPISSFFVTSNSKVIHIKGHERPMIQSRNLNLRILAPRGAIDESISIIAGHAQKGIFVSRHKNEGFELTYVIRGSCLFKHGGKEYKLEEGDLIYFDGSVPHSVKASEGHDFLGIHFLKK
jgi:transcriptional regulator with XRE-family HTH domain